MKKYLFLAIAALGLAACAEKGLDNNGPEQKGELEQSYVAVTLAADDMGTKATNGNSYEEGLDVERAVKSAYFFFFKDGQPFEVTENAGTTTPGGGKSYLSIALSGSTSDMDNVSDIKDVVLVIKNYKGEYPNQIVTVLNWTPTADKYTLAALKEAVVSLGSNADGYVMSNSVYVDNEGQAIDAVALTEANIGTTEDMAKANPVTVHVERIAAKVVLTTTPADDLFSVGKSIDGTDVYAKVLGWELYNDHETSYLLKNINGYADWTGTAFGFTNWNDPDWFRSYWANSLPLTTPFPNNTFAHDNTSAVGGYVYCGENTHKAVKDGEGNIISDPRTKVIVKAQLVKADGTTAVEIANWYGKDYIGEAKLRDVVANTLKNTYFASTDGLTFVGLLPDDLKCVARAPEAEKPYEVDFQLSDAGVAKTWYKYAEGEYTAIDDDALDTELMSVQPALVYKEGMTYYYTDIKHLGTAGSDTEFGVVRNHVYKVNISAISGYGTPYYEGNIEYIKPEKPVDVTSYVAAEVKILSWRVVDNDYEL